MGTALGFLLGNLWRTAALVLIAVALVQSLRLDSAQQAAEHAEQRAMAAEALERSTAATWELHSLQLQGQLRTCQLQWIDAQQRARSAVADAIAARKKAEDQLADYQTRWLARTQHCGAALLDASRACPELRGY
jgi:hypothetical protein